jgi:hypothetical protein
VVRFKQSGFQYSDAKCTVSYVFITLEEFFLKARTHRVFHPAVIFERNLVIYEFIYSVEPPSGMKPIFESNKITLSFIIEEKAAICILIGRDN